jgi:bifunctional UDP-N-acetylglucosamine pyrophosphorylase/glucosamine-1-phosphate N-acetyltransferase
VTATRPVAAVVLAAGEGTRMRSARPKVLHEIGGRTLLEHAVAAVAGLAPERLVVVVGHGREQVEAHLAEVVPWAVVAVQDEVPGTGRAAWCGLQALVDAGGRLDGPVVVTYGDVPLLATATLADLLAVHGRTGAAVTMLTAELPDPTGYGRVLRGADGRVEGVVEQRDATPEQALVRETNSGTYVFDGEFLRRALDGLGRDNAVGEVYLTDAVAVARAEGAAVEAVRTDDVRQTEGVNDQAQLASLGRALRDRLVAAWMRAGVTVVDPETTWVDVDVVLEPDVTLLPGTQLLGATTVSAGATIGPDTTLRDCVVGRGATVVRSHGTGAEVGAGADVGPFSYLRPGTRLGADGKIGAFVETKNAVIGDGTKVPHLTYVGDAEIGTNSNIGAATVFVNFDGVDKHRTVVGNDVRIGSDTMLVAPVVVGDGAYTAAGSVVDEDVPPGALAIARARQRNVEGWVERRRPGSPAARAATRARSAEPQAGQSEAGQDPPSAQGPEASGSEGQ